MHDPVIRGSSAGETRVHLHTLQSPRVEGFVVFWISSGGLAFMLTSTLNSTWPGPVGETYSFSPAGSGLSPFQDNAATIFTIAHTGAMLQFKSGKNAPKKLRP
jgi:hypothetical protein